MRYPNLDYAKHLPTTLDFDNLLAKTALDASHGQRTMSDEDIKLALVSIFHACKTQQKIIDELVVCVNELRKPKKKLWHRRRK